MLVMSTYYSSFSTMYSMLLIVPQCSLILQYQYNTYKTNTTYSIFHAVSLVKNGHFIVMTKRFYLWTLAHLLHYGKVVLVLSYIFGTEAIMRH